MTIIPVENSANLTRTKRATVAALSDWELRNSFKKGWVKPFGGSPYYKLADPPDPGSPLLREAPSSQFPVQ